MPERGSRRTRSTCPTATGGRRTARYPVLYVLDGRTHFVHTAASTDFLAAEGEIPETIVVAIASTVRVRDFTQTDWKEAWVGGGGAANFKRFLSTELIPAVEKAYRTDGFRTLSGHSAGGQFVLYTLTSEPALFHAYVALSPSLDWDQPAPGSLAQEGARVGAVPERVPLRRAVGRLGPGARGLGGARRRARRPQGSGLPLEHRGVPRGTAPKHPPRRRHPRAACALRRIPNSRRGSPTGDIEAVTKHYEAYSRTLGLAGPADGERRQRGGLRGARARPAGGGARALQEERRRESSLGERVGRTARTSTRRRAVGRTPRRPRSARSSWPARRTTRSSPSSSTRPARCASA